MIRKGTVSVGVVVCVLASIPAAAQFLTNGVINGTNTPKRSVFLTFDDGTDEYAPDGSTQIQKVAQYLQGPITIYQSDQRSSGGVLKSIRASFAIVTCHFTGQDPPAPNSSMCIGLGDMPESIAADLLNAGHDIFNHSVNHIPLTSITDPNQLIYEVGHAQVEIDKLRGDSPRVFRAPGLAYSGAVGTALNADPSTNTIIGPIDADVGGAFDVDGNWIGGDWDCVAMGMTVPVCGELYLQGIRQATHGSVVLLHVRTEDMSGRDGNPYPLELIHYIVEHLGPEYEYLPLDAIPGVSGGLMTGPATQVSSEFTASDGQGPVVAGVLAGAAQPASICKARGATIACKAADGQGGFAASQVWMTIGDPTWTGTYNSAFWLADVTGDGLADLIYPASGSLWVAFNNGVGGFYPPVVYYCGNIPDAGYIRFGKVAGSKMADMVIWTPDLPAPALYVNDGVRFVPPAASSNTGAASGIDTHTMQLIDINGDGKADLVVRGENQVLCALSAGPGFASVQACSIAGGPFAQASQWWNTAYADTFAVANINGPVIVDGQPTGVIFAPFSSAAVSNRYRYLCNDCFTNAVETDWHPELRASQIVWADFIGGGVDSPLFIRADGLYLALTGAQAPAAGQ